MSTAPTPAFFTAPTKPFNEGARLGTAKKPGGPGERRPGVSAYRTFVTVVFIVVVVVDAWADRTLSASVIDGCVGPVSVLVWVLTLLGSFDVGPVAALWRRLHR